MATLNTHVGVHHPEHGSVLLSPGVEVPEWAIPLIENPEVWAEAPAAEDHAPDGEAETGGEDTEPSVPASETPAEDVPVPAKAGPKATAEAWAAYALAKGFEVAADATRSEIIEALEVEGITTE